MRHHKKRVAGEKIFLNSDLPELVQCHAYYDVRDELTVQEEMVFKGPLMVVLAAMRKEMMAVAHATHIGIEGCLRRARETMHWPRMSAELKEYMLKWKRASGTAWFHSTPVVQDWRRPL